ncbi:hypothetical protein BKA57DRAFT_432693 [Linnemannia elongata]|nr:hypothetical protein BKA57DRAFT_432693 [Linnemannia elongata]
MDVACHLLLFSFLVLSRCRRLKPERRIERRRTHTLLIDALSSPVLMEPVYNAEYVHGGLHHLSVVVRLGINASPSHSLNGVRNGGRGRYPTDTFEDLFVYI